MQRTEQTQGEEERKTEQERASETPGPDNLDSAPHSVTPELPQPRSYVGGKLPLWSELDFCGV